VHYIGVITAWTCDCVVEDCTMDIIMDRHVGVYTNSLMGNETYVTSSGLLLES